MHRNVIIIGGTKSDAHVVSIYLVELFLKERGYRVINKSCQNSVEELLGQGDVNGETLAVILVNQNGQALDDLDDLADHKAQMLHKVPIILGGHYWIGCDRQEAYVDRLTECGVDYQIDVIEELAPLLKRISRDKPMSVERTRHSL